MNRTDSSNYSNMANMAPLYRILEIRPDMYVTPPVYNTERPKTLGLYLNSLPLTIVVGQYPTLISAELNEERIYRTAVLYVRAKLFPSPLLSLYSL